MSVLDHIQRIPNHPGSTRRNGRALSDIRWVVIHTMESGEGASTAEDVAAWLSRGGPGTPAGVHYCVDQNSIVQMGDWDDVTAGAGGTIPGRRGANFYSVHIELAGKAGQTKKQWEDKASTATLENAAALCREILCPQLSIPVRHLTVPQVKALEKGFVGHVDITKATKKNAGHWDPGPNFSWQHFLELVSDGDASQTSIPIFVAGKLASSADAFRDEGLVYAWVRPIMDALGGSVAYLPNGDLSLVLDEQHRATFTDYELRDNRAFVPVRKLGLALQVPISWVDGAVRIG